MDFSQMDPREFIARKIAEYLPPGTVVNLGVGIPTRASDYTKEGVWVQAENGILGIGPHPEPGIRRVESYRNASGEAVIPVRGACTFDAELSFGMMRSGRVDTTVLGALQVAQNGDLANWTMPGRSPGMGGAMDIVSGVKRVIVATRHCNKDGVPKIVKECTYPLTGIRVVSLIITEYCVFDIVDEHLVLLEKREDISLEKLKEITDAPFDVSPDCKTMTVEV